MKRGAGKKLFSKRRRTAAGKRASDVLIKKFHKSAPYAQSKFLNPKPIPFKVFEKGYGEKAFYKKFFPAIIPKKPKKLPSLRTKSGLERERAENRIAAEVTLKFIFGEPKR